MNQIQRSHEMGGAALEYIIVSVFGLTLALGAIGIVTKAAKEKLSLLEERFGISIDISELNPFAS